MDQSSLISRKYCCDPFNKHKNKVKGLHAVTDDLTEENPELHLMTNSSVCSSCRKKLSSNPNGLQLPYSHVAQTPIATQTRKKKRVDVFTTADDCQEAEPIDAVPCVNATVLPRFATWQALADDNVQPAVAHVEAVYIKEDFVGDAVTSSWPGQHQLVKGEEHIDIKYESIRNEEENSNPISATSCAVTDAASTTPFSSTGREFSCNSDLKLFRVPQRNNKTTGPGTGTAQPAVAQAAVAPFTAVYVKEESVSDAVSSTRPGQHQLVKGEDIIDIKHESIRNEEENNNLNSATSSAVCGAASITSFFSTGRDSSHNSDLRLFRRSQCNYKTTRPATLFRHTHIYTVDKACQSSGCDYKTKRSSGAIQRNATKPDEKALECAKPADKAALKACSEESAQRVETDETPFECCKCSYKAALIASLDNHMRSHAGKKPHKCSECGYKATQISAFVSHMRIHIKHKPFKCPECSYRGAQKSALTRHTRTHTGEKPFECSECSYKATEKSALNNHMRTHTGDKPFKCSKCSFKAAQQSTLYYHMQTHSGDKPFKCSQCPYRASRKSNLIDHVRTHSRRKPFKCTECSFKARQKSVLNRHMQTHIGEEEYDYE